jgi:hypothetical protein
MLRTPRTALLTFALAVGLSSLACGGGTTPTDGPQEKAEITSPASGLKVTAAISSVALGDSYANVQLAFQASTATNAASVQIVSVTLVDAASGNVVDTMDAKTPQVWNGTSYVTWNQQVTPGGDLKASYQLSAPDWSTIQPSGTGTSSRSAYSTAYKLRVTLRIDGVDVLMQSTDLHREAQFQT